jgi:hypothetical protein
LERGISPQEFVSETVFRELDGRWPLFARNTNGPGYSCELRDLHDQLYGSAPARKTAEQPVKQDMLARGGILPQGTVRQAGIKAIMIPQALISGNPDGLWRDLYSVDR